MNEIINKLNWATCDGLKECGIQYWSFIDKNNVATIYFKDNEILSFNSDINIVEKASHIISSIIIKADKYKEDKDMQRFLKFIVL